MMLPVSCKSVFFILQNIHYLQTGVFAVTSQELLERLTGKDKEVLALSMKCKGRVPEDFDHAFSLLFDWCQNAIVQIGGSAEGIPKSE